MTLKLNGSSSGYTAIDAPASAGSNTLVLPANNGSAGQILQTDGSGNLTWVDKPTGIKHASQWRVNSDWNPANGSTIIDSNWEEVDTDYARIGSALTESSGIFSFPETGVWKVEGYGQASFDGSTTDYVNFELYVTTDNGSNWNRRAYGAESIPADVGGMAYTVSHCDYLFDVTNTTNCKVKFHTETHQDVTWRGDSNFNETWATFIRLGDT